MEQIKAKGEGMFGRRSDGRVVKRIDPIVALTPYIMPQRCDAQVMLRQRLDYETLARYIVKKKAEGHAITFMEIIIAAFVRTVAALPEVNRFILNKRLYVRTQLTVSFILLMDTPDGSVAENTVKCHFDPSDTIYDVAARISAVIAKNRKAETGSDGAMKVAKLLLNPLLANVAVGLLKFLDRYGLMPKAVLDASPFHTSLFLTNMASIGMPPVFHHIYNFGSTTMFFGIGGVERDVEIQPDGSVKRKRWLPVQITVDERVAAGAVFAKMMHTMQDLCTHPEKLETPPDAVIYDEGHEYHVPKPGEPASLKKRRLRGRRFRRKPKPARHTKSA